MIAEQSYGLPHRFHPTHHCTYDADVDDTIDLRTLAEQQRAGVPLAELACGWRYDLIENREPASWRITGRLSKTSAGILAPSFAAGATPAMHKLGSVDLGAASRV
jgi:RES domain-containing protein